MKKKALFLTLLGILALILFLNYTKLIKIHSQEELKPLIQNQKVQFSGKVIQQKDYNKITFLTLSNNITLLYSGQHFNFINREIKGRGTYDDYNYPKIKVLELKIK